MKGIALWQPYASFVACGLKRVETRGWPAPEWLVGQRIAIHATKGVEPGGERAFLATCARPRFRWALGRMAVTPKGLPRGALVATAVLDSCTEMTDESIYEVEAASPVEFEFGDYQPGRFAWALSDPRRLREPVPFAGGQRIFNVPDDVIWWPAEQGVLL